jgi:hypothetical protein
MRELRLRAEGGTWPPAVIAPETFVRRLAQQAVFAEYALLVTPHRDGIELRLPGNVSGMPDALVRIEDGGFYLLDNNTMLADLVLGQLVRYLLGTFDRVTLEEG